MTQRFVRTLSSTVAALAALRLLACSSERPEVLAGYTPPDVTADAAPAPPGTLDGGADAASTDAEPTGCPPPDVRTGEPPPPGLCLPSTVWSQPTVLPFSSGTDVLTSMTPDERTVAVLRASGPAGVLNVFDRDDVDSPFAEPTLIVSDVPVRPARAALSPDGLRLVLLGGDWRSFVVLERASRSEPFEPSDDASPAKGAFATLNAEGAALGPDEAFDDPVFGADGASFLYSVLPGGGRTLRVSVADTHGVWQVGTPVDDCELRSLGEGKSRRPTGLTADGRTLFYIDEVRGIARAAFRDAARGPFTEFIDLGARLAPQVSAGCERLYSSRLDGVVTDVLYESR